MYRRNVEKFGQKMIRIFSIDLYEGHKELRNIAVIASYLCHLDHLKLFGQNYRIFFSNSTYTPVDLYPSFYGFIFSKGPLKFTSARDLKIGRGNRSLTLFLKRWSGYVDDKLSRR